MTNPDLFDKPARCGCTSDRKCARHDPRMTALRSNLLALIPAGKENRTVISRIIPALYSTENIQQRDFEALDMEVREQIKILKDEGKPVVTGRAGVWLADDPQDMIDSFKQRIRHGATEIKRVKAEVGSKMYAELIGQCEVKELVK